MKVKAIDAILKAIEIAADDAGWRLDEISVYCEVCQIVTDFDYNGIVPTFEQKQFCAEVLETMCGLLGINYLRLLIEALEKED